ncbi:MAG: toll/interleukin-1 receptor domain-containing protein [Sulfuriferula multivorans]|uniref:Toll/interleukin-1 receptor domain-containing protein n=1 Tax=Sulfuriferula multivorans TaxID=1559896 RepID=A0A7C9P8M0_9PROT|nr:toll/interleukin-1 receptor domain-containing protein [Sulfuriferula multivorans]
MTSDYVRSVFISYATKDKERAFEICSYLEALGHSCWIAPRDIQTGKDYAEEIICGIEKSRCFVLILSAAANASLFVKREVERAVSKGKPVFPVRVEDVLPAPALEFHLASLQFLDAWSGVLKTHIEQLSRDITEKADFLVSPAAQQPALPFWKQRVVGGSAITVVAAIIAVLWVNMFHQPSPVIIPVQTQPSATSVKPSSHSESKKSDARVQEVSCRKGEGSTLRCSLGESKRIKIRSATGDELFFENGSGSTEEQSRNFSKQTFVAWPGPGATAQLSLSDGSWAPAQPLPSLVDKPAAALIRQDEPQKPPLAYTIYKQADWIFLFFAPWDVQDVEWAVDAKGYIRAEPMPWQRLMGGPYWIKAADSAVTNLSVRWRKAGEQWSAPANYSFDSVALRKAVAASLADPAKQISCRRRQSKSALTICKAAQGFALGELFKELRWGADAKSLADVSTYDFSEFSEKMLAKLPPRPTCNDREAGCVDSKNKAGHARGMLETELRTIKSQLVAWTHAGEDYRSDFLVTDELMDEVFFKAIPRGGGEAVVARIPVASR